MKKLNKPGRYKCINIPKFISNHHSNTDLVRDHFDANCIVDILVVGDGDGYAHVATTQSLQLAIANSEWDLFECVSKITENINRPGVYKCIDIPKFIRDCRSMNCDLVCDYFESDGTVNIVSIDAEGEGYVDNVTDASLQFVIGVGEWDLFELVEQNIVS